MPKNASAIESDGPPGWERYAEDNWFMQHIGPIWQRRVEENHEYAFRVAKVHTSLLDIVHGGMLCTFADHALGHVVYYLNDKRPVVTIHLDINFIAGAHLGEFIECRTEVVRRTRSICFMRGTLVVGSRCVATAGGVWKLIGA